MNTHEREQREAKAKELFRIVHGKGDAGSELAFDCQNPSLAAGWLRLAKKWLELERDLQSAEISAEESLEKMVMARSA